MNRVELVQKKCPTPELSGIVAAAVTAGLTAGRIIRSLYGTAVRIDHKGEIDLVTEADQAAEAAIIKILAEKTPGVALLAEESSSAYQGVPEGPVWVIDPLDGTTNFAHGFPWFGVSIGYWDQGRVRAGVIYCPMTDELFWAGEGCGAWLNEKPLRVSEVVGLDNSLLATGFPYDIHQAPEDVVGALGNMLVRVQGVRRAGAAALDLAYLACGRLDGFWEIKLKPWDTAAGMLLVTEAGGRITDFAGNDYSPFVPELLASNATIHQPMIEILKEFSRAGKDS